MTPSTPPKKRPSPMWLLGVFIFVFGLWVGVQLLDSGRIPRPVSQWLYENASEKTVALALFDDAWYRAKNEYVDDSMNGQDWGRWKKDYRPFIETYDDAYVAINTMLTSLNDDYTRFLTPEQMNEQHLQIDAQLFGVGIQIMVKDKQLTVVSALSDTPAEAAGLMPNDKIMRIDDELTVGMSVRDAADRIRGKEGTQVTLELKRQGETVVVPLTRSRITMKSVYSEPLEDQTIGYVRLSTFISERASDEMYQVLESFRDKKALILDLRGNYGGLLQNALTIADFFLSEGNIVQVVGQRHGMVRDTQAHRDKEDIRQPMVVLIDGGSASASEILSGALKDHHRARLIGETSFGKGLVQKIVTLPHHAGMNVTISRYLTPDGHDIHKKGIEPDEVVPFTEGDYMAGKDPQKEAAIRYLQSVMRETAQVDTFAHSVSMKPDLSTRWLAG